MNGSVVTKDVSELTGDVLVAPLFEKARRLPPELRDLPDDLTAVTKKIISSEDFTGKDGQTMMVFSAADTKIPRLLLLGLGERTKCTQDTIRQAAGRVIQQASKLTNPTIVWPTISVPKMDAAQFGQVIAEGSALAAFRFDTYRTTEDPPPAKKISIILSCTDRAKARRVDRGFQLGLIHADAANTSRRLVMTPGNDLYPEQLAKEVSKAARGTGIKVDVLGPAEIKKEKMGGVIGVGQGSSRKPRVIVMRWIGNKRKKGIDVCLVGKGVTFDTGGISIKPNPRMTEMIGDMMGAATVIATTLGAAHRKLPINLVTIVPSVENMPSGNAYRPGDIVTTMSGQTVEIISTDAEGRLILADGLTYADRFQPAVIIDVATLTGATEIALGNQAAALMGNHPPTIKMLQKAADATAERVWELPMYEEYAEQIKSDTADMKNSGGRLAGTSIAGWFLRKYVGDNHWAHLDIAAMDWEKKGKPYIPKGCTGFGVRLLIQFLADYKAAKRK